MKRKVFKVVMNFGLMLLRCTMAELVELVENTPARNRINCKTLHLNQSALDSSAEYILSKRIISQQSVFCHV